MRPVFTFAAAFCLSVLVAIPRRAATTEVHIFDFDFSENPQGQPIVDPVINLGDQIEWVWDPTITEHSTTSVAGILESWDSGLHSPPFTFDHTFTHAGTFAYFCKLHGFDNGNGTAGGMSGTVTVLVPEPATVTLLALGLAIVLARSVRRYRVSDIRSAR